MTPVSPVMPGSEPIGLVIGEGQPQYDPLPAVYVDSRACPVISRWRPSAEERELIAKGADIVLQQLTFRNPYQPINLQVVMPDDSPILVEG
jgi:hypothetical protein